MPPLAEWVALVGAISAAVVGLIKATAEASKTRAEVAAMRAELAKGQKAARDTAQLVAESHHQLTPNGGGSIKDATTRLEAGLAELRSDIRGIRRDVGRLTDADAHIAERKEREHDAIHRRLERLERRQDDNDDEVT